MEKFCTKTPCNECPWRKDVAPGQFPKERYDLLRNTVGDDDAMRPIFACHKSREGKELACTGYLIVEGNSNIFVRIFAAREAFSPSELSSDSELFGSYDEMAEAQAR